MNFGEPVVATILGWKCCCDIELKPGQSPQIWTGLGFSRKDHKGVEFTIVLDLSSGRPVATLQMVEKNRKFDDVGQGSIVNGGLISFQFEIGAFFDGNDETISEGRLVVLISGHAELKRKFTNYAFGLSYMPVIWDRFRENPPQRILEWGPGRSSILFAELFPNAEIVGVEHNSHWFENCEAVAEEFPKKVTMHFRNLKLAPAQSEGYVSFPLYDEQTKFDLIFIDGRLRCDCAAIARHVLAENGTVLIHDAHREVYQPCYKLFKSCEIAYNTAILRA